MNQPVTPYQLEQLKDKMTETAQTIQQELTAVQEHVRQNLERLSRDLFEYWPEIESFRWHQTSEWNDSETVTRITRDQDELEINGIMGYRILEEPEHAALRPALEAFEIFVNGIPESILLDMYGVGTSITITREQISLSEYHDY